MHKEKTSQEGSDDKDINEKMQLISMKKIKIEQRHKTGKTEGQIKRDSSVQTRRGRGSHMELVHDWRWEGVGWAIFQIPILFSNVING